MSMDSSFCQRTPLAVLLIVSSLPSEMANNPEMFLRTSEETKKKS